VEPAGRRNSANCSSVKLQFGRPMSPAIATIFERKNASNFSPWTSRTGWNASLDATFL
jgi:hypothetical protein